MELQWNCNVTAMQLQWNCEGTAMKLQWTNEFIITSELKELHQSLLQIYLENATTSTHMIWKLKADHSTGSFLNGGGQAGE